MLNFSLSPRQAKWRGWCGAALAAGALALPPAAHAIDWSSADWGGYSVDSLNYWAHRDLGRRAMEQSRAANKSGGKASSKSPQSALSTANNVAVAGGFVDDNGLERLAMLYPRDEFYQRKKQYRQIVEGFNGSVQKLYGVPANNLATGMTVVLAGAYSAYHNRPFPDDWVKPLYQQLEKHLLQDPRLPQRSAARKAADYQVMVGAGMAMMLAQADLAKSPNPAALKQLRDTGADALRVLMQADPQQIEFTRSGVRVR